MDDGKCLLDVISDPQALKEFFRSTSQIAFVDSEASPIKSENVYSKKVELKVHEESTFHDVIRDDTPSYSVAKQATTIHSSKLTPNSSTLLQQQQQQRQQQTKPLVHFSYSRTPDLNLHPSSFTSHINSPAKNGIPASVSSHVSHLPYSARNELGGSTINTLLSQNNLNVQNTASNTQTVSILSAGKEPVASTRTSYNANTPISFSFGDTSNARNIRSSGTPLVSLEKPVVTTLKQTIGQPVQLKASPSQLVSGIVPGATSQNRTPNVKGTLQPLRPKKIVPRPLTQQNVTTVVSGEQNSGVQGNLLTQGVKGKVVAPVKGQPLIAIQPKLIIAAQPNVGSSGIGNNSTLGIGKPSQTLTGNFTIGSKLQNQVLSSLAVQQSKSGIQNGNHATQSKVSLTNLVQLQPKQIAPKPDQSIGYQVTAKPSILQGQSQIQQQLVQSLLAQTQQSQSQFALQTSLGTVLKDDKQSCDKQQESLVQQQNQLKELLQRKHMLQQAMQVRRVQQQQNSSSVKQVGSISGESLTGTKSVSQSSPLQSLINSSLTAGQAQPKLPPTTSTNTSVSLASQVKNAINAKQLQQFLEKNPVLAQQLKLLNLKQANIPENVTTSSSSTASPVKNIVQLQKPGKPAVTAVSQVSVAPPKKLVVTTSATQPLVINQAQKTDPKPQAHQKVLIVQQASTGATTAPVGQPRVLLQTKEGRPILLSQEQFRQIQQQLASKNLSIQGKLVTTTTTTTTAKPQIVVKPNDPPTTSTHKASPKVTPATKPTTKVKQEVTKGVKRPVKPVESEESKLIKRMKGAIQNDQNDVSFLDIHKPFKTLKDATKSLAPFHVFSEPDPNPEMQWKANLLLDKLAVQLTNKSDRMINKYRQLLFGDMQRNVSSAELVMVNRIFLADEKVALMNEKKTILEEARNMAQSVGAKSSHIKDESSLAALGINSTASDTSNLEVSRSELSLRLFPNSTIVVDDDNSSQMDTSEAQPIDIMDDSPSPMSSANSFLTHLSTPNSELGSPQRTSNYAHDPS